MLSSRISEKINVGCLEIDSKSICDTLENIDIICINGTHGFPIRKNRTVSSMTYDKYLEEHKDMQIKINSVGLHSLTSNMLGCSGFMCQERCITKYCWECHRNICHLCEKEQKMERYHPERDSVYIINDPEKEQEYFLYRQKVNSECLNKHDVTDKIYRDITVFFRCAVCRDGIYNENLVSVITFPHPEGTGRYTLCNKCLPEHENEYKALYMNLFNDIRFGCLNDWELMSENTKTLEDILRDANRDSDTFPFDESELHKIPNFRIWKNTMRESPLFGRYAFDYIYPHKRPSYMYIFPQDVKEKNRKLYIVSILC